MAERERSPFGNYVRTYRHRLGLTQQDLVDRLNQLPNSDGGFTLRTIQDWERRYAPHDEWRTPHAANVRSLAAALGEKPDSDSWLAIQSASRQKRNSIDHSAPPSDPPSAIVSSSPGITTTASAEPELFISAGRQTFLDQIAKVIDAAALGEPGLVFISADPGSGKSWLIREATRQAVERNEQIAVLWGESERYGDPHQAVRQILGQTVGGSATANPQHRVSDRNQRRLQQRTKDGVEVMLNHQGGLLDRFVPIAALRPLLESSDLPPDLRLRLQKALDAGTSGAGAYGPSELAARVLATYAASSPTVVVFEDLHWADTGTVAVLHQLLGLISSLQLPVAIIGSYRPVEVMNNAGGTPSPMVGLLRESPRLIDVIGLDLSTAIGGQSGRDFVQAFVNSRVKAPPEHLVETLFRATAGSPFYVNGMLDWYLNVGALRESSTVGLEWHHDPQALPAEVSVMLESQMANLPADLRRLVDIGSVQGATFSAEILQSILGLSHAELIFQLETQLRLRYRLVEEAGVSITAGVRSHDYRFRHSLHRDTLYRQLSDFEREHYHLAIAAAKATRWGNDPHEGCGRIARHYRLGGDSVRAGEWSHRGGNFWLELHQYHEAGSLFQQVLDLKIRMQSPEVVAQALIGLGNVARGVGNNVLARQHFSTAQLIAHREQFPLVQANALTSEAMLDFDAGRMARGAALLTEAIDVLVKSGDFHEASRSMTLLSHTLHGAGRYAEAASRAEESIALARSQKDELLEAGGMIALGNCWLDIGLYDKAIAIYEECLEICFRHDNNHRAIICWLNIALCCFELGDWERGRDALAEVHASGDRVNPRLIGAAHFNGAVISELTGDLAAARKGYEQSLTIRLENDQSALQVDSWAGLVRTAMGHSDTLPMLEQIETYLATSGLEGIEHPGRLFVTLVDAYGALGAFVQQTVALNRGLDMLKERSALLTNPEHQEIYLKRVPSHRALHERAGPLNKRPIPAHPELAERSGAGLDCAISTPDGV